MPMRKGRSRKIISANIGEAMRSYKRTGKFSGSRKNARKRIIAAALRTARGKK